MTKTRKDAVDLLASPYFFDSLQHVLKRAGLVGERQNALLAYVVGVSRLLPKPLSLFIKGHSSSGKNFLAKKVLELFPPTSVQEISSMTDAAWNYFGKKLMHKIVYIQEMPHTSGTIDPSRLLISENQLIRYVTTVKKGKRVTQKVVTKGPVACISTTTKDMLLFDDESRRLSIWIDESEEQTKRILRAAAKNPDGLTQPDEKVWHEIQRLLKERAGMPVALPSWFEDVADYFWARDIRARRYMPAFVTALQTISVLRSFRLDAGVIEGRGKLTVGIVDFAITSIIFEKAISDSLGVEDEEERATLQVVKDISHENGGEAVSASEVAAEMDIPMGQAYARLRKAALQGCIERANMGDPYNRKLFLPAEVPRFLPDPAVIFREVNCGKDQVQFIHPLRSELVTYTRGRNVRE